MRAAAQRGLQVLHPPSEKTQMPKIREVGTVLRLYPMGERGAIVCWCTAGHGMVRTASRSVLKPGSELAGVVDLFHECEFVYHPTAKSDLCTLDTAELLTPRLALRGNLLRLRLASYMAQLLLSTVEPGGPEDSAWHKLISTALDYVATATLRPEILYRFERRLAELHGLYAAGVNAHSALLHHFTHLPAGRGELLEQLHRSGADSAALPRG